MCLTSLQVDFNTSVIFPQFIFLTDEALKTVGFKFKSPIAPSEEEVEDEEVDEDMEVDLEKVGHHKPTLTS